LWRNFTGKKEAKENSGAKSHLKWLKLKNYYKKQAILLTNTNVGCTIEMPFKMA